MNKLESINISKSFIINNEVLNVLSDISFSIHDSEKVAISDKSG